MNNNELLKKFSNNEVILFIVPNFLYLVSLFSLYNDNFSFSINVNVLEVAILGCLFFLINLVCYFGLKKLLKDKKKVFLILVYICSFLGISLPNGYFYFFLIILVGLICLLKFENKVNFDNVVALMIFIISFYFLFSFIGFGDNVIKYYLKVKSYDNNLSINVKDDVGSPNIYWIHCDGMMNNSIMKNYFNDDEEYLQKYLDRNGYFSNEDAFFVAGHRTIQAITALLNPNYYDNFYKKYLDELEAQFIDEREEVSFFVSFDELVEKKNDNELFNALHKKGYTTVSIGKYDQHSSLDADYIYDFYYPNFDVRSMQQLRLLDSSNINKLHSYVDFLHFKSVVGQTIFNKVGYINYLDYETVDFNDVDVSDYEYLSDTNYWPAKAIIKSIDLVKNLDNKFLYINYDISHTPILYDKDGNWLSEDNQHDLSYYLGNYKYASYLLSDILEYIITNDPNAVIVVQGDHGIHAVPEEIIKESFEVDNQGVQLFRNSTINAVYVPEMYRNGDEMYLGNPLNISRYIVNNYVGGNYEYIE